MVEILMDLKIEWVHINGINAKVVDLVQKNMHLNYNH